ncbi:MAG: hypothetical protein IMZ62_10725 [Chloroflexi bacterium]|nr:hypothetical protein [Chloroflexota bacterium]
MQDSNSELVPARSNLEAASRESDALRRENERLKGEIERWARLAQRSKATAILAVVQSIVLILTLVVVMGYTWATFGLQEAAKEQIKQTKEQTKQTNDLVVAARRQNEIATTPIVLLGVADASADLVVRNIGLGPAVNAHDTVMGRGDTQLTMYHVAAFRPDQAEGVGYLKTVHGHKEVFNSKTVDQELKAMFPAVLTDEGEGLCTAYSDVGGKWYETRQSVRFSSDPNLPGMSGIIITFRGQKPLGNENDACR